MTRKCIPKTYSGVQPEVGDRPVWVVWAKVGWVARKGGPLFWGPPAPEGGPHPFWPPGGCGKGKNTKIPPNPSKGNIRDRDHMHIYIVV